MEFFAKSKTFLVGEYSVLFGGSAILLLTDPEFRLNIKKSNSGSINNICRDTPAFLLYKKYINFLHSFSIDFIDPHEGRGGFGASSAQFVMLYKLYLAITNKKFDINELLIEYRSLSKGYMPSGADCIAQYFNQHTYFNAQKVEAEKIEWTFKNVIISIFKTAVKISTHLHLISLKRIDDGKLNDLNEYVQDTKNAICNGNAELFCSSIQKFYDILCSLGLVIGNTRQIIKKLLCNKEILAVKGCGALSADTIIIVHKKDTNVCTLAESLGLKYIARIDYGSRLD